MTHNQRQPGAAPVRARNRALTRLAKKYPQDYVDLVNDERRREGLSPVNRPAAATAGHNNANG